jgi:hypothetical protein
VAVTSKQRPQSIDRSEEIAARVLLHHGQEQVSGGVPGEPPVLEHRQPREENLTRLALVTGQRERALEHVAGRQYAQLVAQLS